MSEENKQAKITEVLRYAESRLKMAMIGLKSLSEDVNQLRRQHDQLTERGQEQVAIEYQRCLTLQSTAHEKFLDDSFFNEASEGHYARNFERDVAAKIIVGYEDNLRHLQENLAEAKESQRHQYAQALTERVAAAEEQFVEQRQKLQSIDAMALLLNGEEGIRNLKKMNEQVINHTGSLRSAYLVAEEVVRSLYYAEDCEATVEEDSGAYVNGLLKQING